MLQILWNNWRSRLLLVWPFLLAAHFCIIHWPIFCCICLLSQMICVFIWVEGTKAIESGGVKWMKRKSLLCVSLHFGRLRIFSLVVCWCLSGRKENCGVRGGDPPCAFFSELRTTLLAVELLLVAGLLPLSRNNRIDERHFWYTPAKRINRRQQQWSGDISSFLQYFFAFIFPPRSHQLMIVCLVFFYFLLLTFYPAIWQLRPPDWIWFRLFEWIINETGRLSGNSIVSADNGRLFVSENWWTARWCGGVATSPDSAFSTGHQVCRVDFSALTFLVACHLIV